MDNLTYEDFKNICRTCMSNCDTNFNKNSVMLDIFHKLTDVHFESNSGLPQQICLKCFDLMIEIHSFSMTCKQTHSVLMKCLNDYKKKRTKEEQEIVEETNEKIKDEITIDEHKIEFVNVEVDNDREINEEMEIKSKIAIEEHKIEFIKVEVEHDWETNDVSNKNMTERTNDLLPSLLSKIRSENEEDHISEEPSVSETSNNHKCDQCEKSFKHLRNLIRHKRVHSGDRPFKCDQCEKSFAQSGTLIKHKRVHSGARPYKCDQCELFFTQLTNLKRHKRVHTGERPYKCDLCKKSFAESGKLTKHKRVHSGARPYKCDCCQKSFSQLNSLKVHKRVHSAERPFNCDQCKKAFNRSDTLKSHKRLHNRKVN